MSVMQQEKRILFVTSFHPSAAGYIGAGEALSADTLRRLKKEAGRVDVLCMAPSYQRKNPDVGDWCDSYAELPTSNWTPILGILKNFFRGAWVAPWLFTRVSPKAISVLQEVIREKKPSEIWIDFPSSLGFVNYIDGLPISYFVHDVVSQKISRSTLKKVICSWVKRVEISLLHRVKSCVLISDKDQKLLMELGFEGETAVWGVQNLAVGEVDNACEIKDVIKHFGSGQNIVFFGNMGRPENSWSIIHFSLLSFWRIRREFPKAKLWIIGISPGFFLRLLMRLVPGVEVTGAVDSPFPAFEAATLCVAPLLFGAGVKIKVLQMLDAGATVISTEIGAEGIAKTPKLIIVKRAQLTKAIVDYLYEVDDVNQGSRGDR